MNNLLTTTFSIAIATLNSLPAYAQITEKQILNNIEHSAETYCSEKDIGTKEEEALESAQLQFIVKSSNNFEMSQPQFYNSLSEDNWETYWKFFNIFAYEKCPEYY